MNKVRPLLPILILAFGVFVLALLVKTKPKAERMVGGHKGTAVELLRVDKISKRVTVRARGIVIPARQVALGPEVGGRVVSMSERLLPGGRFAEGEPLLRIDPSDYRLAVEQQFAAVDSAQTSLELEESRKRIAEREWELFKEKNAGKGSAVALREPQLRSAQTRLKSAKSGLRRARLKVSRTVLKAPFNGMVQKRATEEGQMVAPGTPLVTFVGTDSYWVQVSMPVERLAWIKVPGVAGESEGSRAQIHYRTGDQHVERSGEVLRLLADVDAAGHMARVLVEIEDPLGVKGQAPEGASPRLQRQSSLPLLLGSYVEVEIEGRSAKDVVELPRIALREDSSVYTMENDQLAMVEVKVLWRQEDRVLISGGLEAGDRVIVSPLSAAVEGMKLRLPVSANETSESQRAAAKAERAPAGGREAARGKAAGPAESEVAP